jgi:hypothetical protein
MATINSSAIFPSIKYLSTDADGDLDELVGDAGQASEATIDGIKYTAVTAGVAGDSITIELLEGQAVTGVEVSASGNAVTIATELGASNYTLQDIADAFGLADASVTDLVGASITGVATDAISGTYTATNLASGQEPTAPELDPNSDYIVIKRTDIKGFEQSEEQDGRKLIWGILDKASDVYESLTDSPENLTLVRSSKGVVNSGNNLRQTYTLQATYALLSVDLASEA